MIAREICAEGHERLSRIRIPADYDPYVILSDWLAWRRDRPVPRRPDAAFHGFVRKWQAVRPKLG